MDREFGDYNPAGTSAVKISKATVATRRNSRGRGVKERAVMNWEREREYLTQANRHIAERKSSHLPAM